MVEGWHRVVLARHLDQVLSPGVYLAQLGVFLGHLVSVVWAGLVTTIAVERDDKYRSQSTRVLIVLILVVGVLILIIIVGYTCTHRAVCVTRPDRQHEIADLSCC